jgi:calpain-7
MLPAVSASSKYILRLFFNGCYRRVVIDDFLPASTDSRIFHVIDRCNPGYLWPALVEKAYLKVRGGYDFPGSNSGTDLAVLTGWLPEQVFLHDEDVMQDELWSRVYKAFTFGDVLITIGTGKLSRREQRQLGLAAEHDFAILDMRETGHVKEMLIKNPWSDGDVWKGDFRRRLASDTGADDHHSTPMENPSPTDADEKLTPGTFWMVLGSVFQHFENLYLNWNPGLFSKRQDYHFSWDLAAQETMTGSFETNPQFSVKCSHTGALWLLLNRHFRTGDYQSRDKVPHGFISLYLFKKGGQRVLLSDGAVIRGSYVDSPNTLIKLEAGANTSYTVVAAAQDMPKTKLNFTLSAFARCPIELSLARDKYHSVVSKNAAWTRSTAGGNSDSPTYLANPQFSLKLMSSTNIAVLLGSLQSEKESKLAVHVKVFFTDGSRVTTLRTRDIVAHSGDYRRGSAALETTLHPGSYTIVCSTFEAGQLGKFTASVHSSSEIPPALRPLPAEGGGRLTTTSQSAIFSAGTNRLLAPLTAMRLTRANLVVQLLPVPMPRTRSPHSSSPLKLTLEQGQGPYKRCLATSSLSEDLEYSDTTTGIRIDDFDIRPEMHGPGTGGLWIVLQRMVGSSSAMQMKERFQVVVMAEERVGIGAWGLGDG